MKKMIALALVTMILFSAFACAAPAASQPAPEAAPAPAEPAQAAAPAAPAAPAEPEKTEEPLDWPKQTINIICTHGAGGDTDYNARLISRLLEEKLGVSVVVNNVTGSNGAIAMTQYKDETPDGYTFVMTNTAALSGNEATGLADYGYDAFVPVCIYGKQAGENIIVPADSPYQTLGDLIAASQANPNKITFGISTGGGVYIASVVLKQAGKAEFAVMEEGDAATRLTALLGGHVDATIVPYSVAKEHIEAGSVRSLATLLEDTPTLIPDVVPACKTVPELIINTLYVCLAPNGTDPKIAQAMNDAILDIVNNSAEYKEEVNSYNLQDPWALNVADTVVELQAQRNRFMAFADFLR